MEQLLVRPSKKGKLLLGMTNETLNLLLEFYLSLIGTIKCSTMVLCKSY